MGLNFQITVDCADADLLTDFWCTALGYVPEPPPGDFETWADFFASRDTPAPPPGSIRSIVDPDGHGPRMFFIRVLEPKTVKNRVHFDIHGGDTADDKAAKVAELVAAGATEIERVTEGESSWVVMADPEGNEFCVE